MIIHEYARSQSLSAESLAALAGGRAIATEAMPRAPLAPEPGSAGLDGIQDAMSMMYELVARQGNESMSTGEVGVKSAGRAQENEASRQAAALKQQEADEAKMETGSLWGSICNIFSNIGNDLAHGRIGDACSDAVSGTVNTLDSPHIFAQLEAIAPDVADYVGVAAACVGASAVTGGTGGVAIAAVVIALSASGLAVEKTGCLGKDSAYIGMGLQVAGAVVSFGASSAMAADSALVTASAALDGVSGTADIVAGAGTITVGQEQAAVQDDTANFQQATVALNRNARIVSDLVEGLKDAQASNKTALHVLAGAAQTYGQTLTFAAASAGTKA